MRARLEKMRQGQEYRFICSPDMAGKMDRVINFAGGVVKNKQKRKDGTVITVIKSWQNS